jgi:hypothetical protein
MTKPRDQTYYFNHMTGAWVIPYDWQTKIRKDDYYEIVTENLPVIYGVVLEASHKNGFFRVRAYSTWCLGGELGIVCVVEPTRILTIQEFECARQQSWKIEEQTVEMVI